eukprot:304117-Lingulodinium_polyedra.AAC.1
MLLQEQTKPRRPSRSSITCPMRPAHCQPQAPTQAHPTQAPTQAHPTMLQTERTHLSSDAGSDTGSSDTDIVRTILPTASLKGTAKCALRAL